MRGWSLYCRESYWLAELAYSYGYGLSCYYNPGETTTVDITPGMFSQENDPNIFSQERMTRKQIREYRDLSEKVYRFNVSWTSDYDKIV